MKKMILANMLRSLFVYEGIRTTLGKARQIKPIAEHLIHIAKRGDLAARRQVLQTVPHPSAVKILFDTIAPRYENRKGGYLRVIRAGWRKGDGAPVALIELIDRPKRAKKLKKVKAQVEETPTEINAAP